MGIAIVVQTSQVEPFWIWPAVLGGILAIAILLRFLNRLFPSSKNHHSSLGNALMRAEAIFLPGREHLVEAREQDEAEEDEEGEPPETGSSG
jgi:hypothetical protein